MFLQPTSAEFNNYKIHSELWFPSYYAPLTVNILIKEEFIPRKKCTIIRNSKKESEFMESFTKKFGNIDMMFIADKATLESILQEYADIADTT